MTATERLAKVIKGLEDKLAWYCSQSHVIEKLTAGDESARKKVMNDGALIDELKAVLAHVASIPTSGSALESELMQLRAEVQRQQHTNYLLSADNRGMERKVEELEFEIRLLRKRGDPQQRRDYSFEELKQEVLRFQKAEYRKPMPNMHHVRELGNLFFSTIEREV